MRNVNGNIMTLVALVMHRLSVKNWLSALSATFLDIGIGNNLADYSLMTLFSLNVG